MKNCIVSFIAAMGVAFGSSSVWAQTQDAFFQENVLQDVLLRISARDWQMLKATYDQDTYYAADLTWHGVTVRNVGIRSRGNTTRNGTKPALRVDINRYISSQEFLGLKAFALDNAYSDASQVHESVTMKMFVRFGLPAPREAHARLFVNDEYVGAYVIVESIDRTFVARVFGAAEADVERGGYLYEYQWLRPYGFENLGPTLEPYAALFTPQTRDSDSMGGLYNSIRDLVRTISEDSSVDLSDVRAKLDVERALKYLAIENFMAETDGLVGEWGLHNFYLYRFQDGQPAQLIPWDKDAAFSSAHHPTDYHLDTNVLVARAMAVPELQAVYVNTLLACAAVAEEPDAADPRGWLEREVERETSLVRSAVESDPVTPFSFDQFEGEIDRLVQFARSRSGIVRCALSASNSMGAQACTSE